MLLKFWGFYRRHEVRMSSDWSGGSPKSDLTGVLPRRGTVGHGHTGKGHVKTEAELGVVCLQARERRG